MRLLGNLIWFFCSGLWAGLAWFFVSLLLCLTIVGIPFGLQCFKIGSFGLFPFGKDIVPASNFSSLFFNIIWIIFFGWELAAMHLASAIVLCLTIVGIPFALQSIKLAGISLFPFGVTVIENY
ncbi:YccF domain-containing protein [Streptococcus sobrinus]|uniref:YccF domain-containing protein n=1 Tax=Streptococcus sobrinus TaxID=1310 RepID=UPI0002DA014C|nr:YccF domain-containing protein [Streptococcus sobrinus]OZV22997.1 YccF family protein [Streptococcus sobrinus]